MCELQTTGSLGQMMSYHRSWCKIMKKNGGKNNWANNLKIECSRYRREHTAVSMWPDSKGQDAGDIRLPAPPSLTIDDPLDPPDAQCDDETDGVPGAAGAVGHCGGHHGGQREDDDSSIKHLREKNKINTHTHTAYVCSTVVWHWGNDTAVKGAPSNRTNGTHGSLPLLCSLCNPISPTPRSWTPSERQTEGQRWRQRAGYTQGKMEENNDS